ncbi:ferritin-like domain-containing protein [Tunturiibacter gelidiferens]|uniref:ferritin-like domain-containing protein n=1 Tax=Tunturiibacter gelidiferens TaxID=3069689 RepID=UPI003D9B62CA
MSNAVHRQDRDANTVEQALAARDGRIVNRRNFMIGVGMASSVLGVALSGCSGSNPSEDTVLAAGPTETDVLNFALNLEFLEATLYSFATQGTDLPDSLIGGSGSVTVSNVDSLGF